MTTSAGPTHFRNGIKSYPRNDVADGSNIKTANYTVTAANCLGATLIMDSTAAATFTLPAIAGACDGGIVTLVNNKRGQLLTVDPNAGDGINFGDQVVDGTTVVNTAATAEKGDFIKLGAVSSASTYWSVLDIGGVWAVGA